MRRRYGRTLAGVIVAVGLAPALAHGDPPKPAPKPAPKRAAPGPVPASRAWHAVTPGRTAPLDGNGRPMLVLQALNMPERVTLTARSERGGFSAEDLDKAAHVLREPSTGNEHPVEPHELDIVYRLQVRFNAPEIRIVSGYRTPRRGSTSNHGRGRAIDLVVPGASDDEVAKWARDLGFVGVGVYPVSGFVHLDVRERSYFWVDTSGPRQRNRTRGILADLATKSDTQALARGERPIGPFRIGADVDAEMRESHEPHHDGPDSEEDDDELTADNSVRN